MKRLLVAVGSCLGAAFAFAATPVDGVLTIDLTEDTRLSQLPQEIACLQCNDVTNVVLQGGKKLTLDVNLDRYTGGWDIKSGTANLTAAKNGFGVYGDGALVVVSSASGQIRMAGNVEVDKPVHFAVSKESGQSDALLYLNNPSQNNVFKRKVTVVGNWGFMGGGSFTTAGGFEQPHKASGHYYIYNAGNGSKWIVENEPIQIDSWNSTYHTLQLNVGGNRIREYTSNYGSAISIQCDDAFAEDCPPDVSVSGTLGDRGNFYFYMNGHNVVLGDANWGTARANIQPGSGAPSLTSGGATDRTFAPVDINAAVRLEKRGTGALTFGKTFDKVTGLTVTEGAVAFADGVRLPACSALSLNGGSITIPSADTLPDTAVYAVADAGAEGVLTIADGVTCEGVGFSIGGEGQGGGVFGGAASTAVKKRDCFSATATGLLSVGSAVTVDVASGAVNLSEAVSGDDYAKINGNDHTVIIKTGAGTLVLDKALAFEGGWEIRGGIVRVDAQDGLGVYGDGAEVKVVDANAQLYVKGNTIDKPVHFTASQANDGKYMLYMNGTTTYFNRKITVDSNLRIFFGGSGTIYCDGGFEQKTGTINDAGASGTWYIRNVPATINAVTLTWQPLQLEVAGNAIKTIAFNDGGKLRVTCDDALSGYKTTITGSSSSMQLDLNGHTLAVGDITASCPIYSTGGIGTLIVENETDSNFNATLGDSTQSISLVKKGAGRKTLKKDFPVKSGTLRVEGGTFDFGEYATGWTGVTLAGGTVAFGGAYNVVRSATVTVADAADEGVIVIADGVTVMADSLYLGAEARQATGYHGGAASAAPAENKLACFDAAATGLLYLSNPYEVTIDEARTLTDAEKDLLVNNRIGKFVKKGSGKLTLDGSLEGYTGAWDFQAGEVYVSTTDHAFGDDLDDDVAAITMNYGAGARFTLANGAVNRRVVATGTAAGDNGSVWFIQCAASTVNFMRYQVTARNGVSVVLQANAATKLTTEGPFVAQGEILMASANGTWDIKGPMTCAATFYPVWANVGFWASNNSIKTMRMQNGTYVTLYADDPFAPETSVVICPDYNASSSRLDLNGHSTTLTGLSLSPSGQCTVGVSTPADKPATLSLAVNAGNTWTLPVARTTVSGPISLVKCGDGTLQINGEMPFKGKSFGIEAGSLVYGADAPVRWRLDELAVAEGATVSIAAGKEVRAKSFAYAGQEQKTGVYGGAASPAPAENRLPCFDPEAGGTVRGGKFGQLLIVR